MNKKIIPLAVVVLLISITFMAYFYAKSSANIIVDFHTSNYTGSEKCKECHEDNYKSWKKTYHRTMTQEATSESVVGQFNGEPQTYWGTTIRPVLKDSKYYFEYYNPETKKHINTLEIKRTVGSRRYQQYLAQTDHTQGNYYRLELLWHIEDKRWVHLNGAFLGSDHQSFDNHTATWNQNCIFCHNTGIQPNMTNYDEILNKKKPGQSVNLKVDSRFDSHVTDLGIGCESCHANGEEHIALNQNPFRKYYLHYSGADDKSIINPLKLSAKKSMDICGQCHGQRTPKTHELAKQWMEKGPTYRPGDDLQSHVNTVWQESLLNTTKSSVFKQRFWKDGTPRLSAYEYQGLLQSQCYIKGDLTCNDCHSMHDGNPKGMIKDENLTNKVCIGCHEEFLINLQSHTGHDEKSDGSICYNCHMPKLVYGLMAFHRSHKIESPNPNYEFNNDKPSACTACHIDKSANWIEKNYNKIWPNEDSKKSFSETSNEVIQSIFKLHSGDPVERGIAASNMNYVSQLISNSEKIYLIPHLLFAMEDSYPAIRRFSFKSLISILDNLSVESNGFKKLHFDLEKFDFISDVNMRNIILSKAWNTFNGLNKSSWIVPIEGSLLSHDYKLDIKTLLKMRKMSLVEAKKIEIGE